MWLDDSGNEFRVECNTLTKENETKTEPKQATVLHKYKKEETHVQS